ncbi:hypothetical protein D1816_02190 [Aquimarina sp. AD10]|uniref:hypothetical protein n=1 Tax=Aquimarina sp. AD10 TaxID=1714849 RepID=UPI000E4FF9B9|nr:hypothetical protein [Aquimarina sp. AD10]AXT59204.1 hypothetical protein D1816_02190 [Aquimarina sp. AD10]RKM92694.1 hypothetical protein D7033_20765 [Aquimarina sp. AD10]
MKKIISLLICVLLLVSCGNKHEGEEKPSLLSNLINITDNENNGIEEILNFYGGRCEYSIGVSASTSDGTKKYFEIEMSQSDEIEKRLDKPILPSSNIAYIFYKNLKEEKKNYDAIHVILVSKNNVEQEFKYPVSTLEKVEQRISLNDKTVNLLKEKKFENLKTMLNNELIPFDKNELVPRLIKLEPQFGDIKEYRFFGFMIAPYKGKDILHLSGALLREKQNHEFSIDVDFNSNRDELYQLQYKK